MTVQKYSDCTLIALEAPLHLPDDGECVGGSCLQIGCQVHNTPFSWLLPVLSFLYLENNPRMLIVIEHEQI